MIESVREKISQPVNSASLVVFRIGFGFIGLLLVFHLLRKQWIKKFLLEPEFHFTYFNLPWLTVPPAPYIYLIPVGMIFGALMILFGCFYRSGSFLFLLSFGFLLILDQTMYQPHFYLVILVAFLILWMPLNRRFSLDAYFNRVKESRHAPLWTLWLLRFQILVVYFYAAINKTQWDWLQCQPIWSVFLDLKVLHSFRDLLQHPILMLTIMVGILLFEYSLVPLLLWKKTRVLMVFPAIIFHLTNKVIFGLNIFPWLSILLTSLFLPPNWPSSLGVPTDSNNESNLKEANPLSRTGLLFMVLFCIFQVLIPLRHHLFQGRVDWNFVGWRYSWRLFQEKKETVGPFFRVKIDSTSETLIIHPRRYLTNRQIEIMKQDPGLYIPFSKYLARKYRTKTFSDVAVSVRVLTSFNGRRPQRLIRPDVNLANQTHSFGTPDWIVPLSGEIPREKSCWDQSMVKLGKWLN